MTPFKRFLLIAGSTVLGIVILAMVAGFIFKDQVKKTVIDALNSRLTAKVEVGDISFSFLTNFPYATIRFENLVVNENKDFVTTGSVLKAENFSLMLSLSSVFKKEYKLKKIVLTNAVINLQTDADGKTNYRIWKEEEEKTQAQPLSLDLENVIFKNVEVLYYNMAQHQDLSFHIEEGTLRGKFNADTYLLESVAELTNTTIRIDQVNYLSEANANIRLKLDVNKPQGNYQFRDSEIQLEGLKLKLDGTISSPETGDPTLDLKLTSPSADLAALLSLIPEKYHGQTKGYNCSGKVEFSGVIKGKYGTKNTPLVAFNFRSSNVDLNPKGTPYHLTKINGSGYFTNRKNRTVAETYLKLENLTALLEGEPFRLNLEIENFTKPRVSLDASIHANLSVLSRFFKPDTIEEISGKLDADFAFYGIAEQKSTYRSSGDVRLSNVNFTLRGKPVAFTRIGGILHLNGNDLVVENLSGSAGNSDFLVNGTVSNLLSFVMLDQQRLEIRASLSSKLIDLDELMAKDSTQNKSDEVVYKLNLSDRLKFHVDTRVGELTFKKFKATDIRGVIAMESRVLITKEMAFNSADGSVMLKGAIDNRIADSLKISYDALVNSLNIKKLFTEMGNFGQQVLVDRNLNGTVSAEVQFRSMWSDRLELDGNSIYVKSDITIEKGELIDFQPMLALSKFLKSADLRTIRFSTLTNTIEIKNRKIFIPLMEIKSTALDLTASGVHTFDNVVDYRLRLYLSQILGKKVRQANTEFGTIEDDGLGRPMIYLTMKGTASDPKFAWDRQGVENKITEEIRKESRTLKSLLKEEFGKKDTLAPLPDKKKKREELQIDYDDEE